MLQQTLYNARLMPGSLSGTNKIIQDRFAALSLKALRLRLQGLDEQKVLEEAAGIRDGMRRSSSRHSEAAEFYFLGEILRRNRDKRCVAYFWNSLRLFPVTLRPWLRILQTLVD
jgi:hypothetical protein